MSYLSSSRQFKGASILVLSLFLTSALSFTTEGGFAADDSIPYPVVGVLTQPSPFSSQGYPSSEYSYIAGSYIRHMESAGLTVVPIQWDMPFDELDVLLGKLNGVLFPGGGTGLVNKTDVVPTPSVYTQTGLHIISKAIEFYNNGDYFPVWGTCLGYELLVLSVSTNMSILIDVADGNDAAKLINITQEGLDGLYADMDPTLRNKLEDEGLSYFHHKHTPDPAGFTNDDYLSSNFSVSAWTNDSLAGDYAASIQGTAHPFMGTQFHPEKNTFEWLATSNIPHSADAISVQEYYAYYFANMTLKNNHRFPSINDLEKYWIYNWQPKHFGPDPEFEEVYEFENFNEYPVDNDLISEYPKGYGPSKETIDVQPAKPVESEEVYRFKEAAPFLFRN